MKLSRLSLKLEQLRLRSLVRRLGLSYDPEMELDVGQVAFLGLASTLAARKPITEVQVDAVLDLFRDQIVTSANQAELDRRLGNPVRASALAILDGTFVAQSGSNQILDLRTGDVVPAVPNPPVEVVSYDLLAIAMITFRAEKS